MQILYHWNGSSYVTDSNDAGFNGNYATIRIWRCGSLYTQNGPVLVGSYGSGASGSTGWFYSGWIGGYVSGGVQCGPQADNGAQDGAHPAITQGSYASDNDIANGNIGPQTYFGYTPYEHY